MNKNLLSISYIFIYFIICISLFWTTFISRSERMLYMYVFIVWLIPIIDLLVPVLSIKPLKIGIFWRKKTLFFIFLWLLGFLFTWSLIFLIFFVFTFLLVILKIDTRLTYIFCFLFLIISLYFLMTDDLQFQKESIYFSFLFFILGAILDTIDYHLKH